MAEHEHSNTGASAALPAEALGAAPGPKSVLMKVLSAGLSGGLLVLLFLVIIPALGDLEEVWAAITSMSADDRRRCSSSPLSASGRCWQRRTRR